MDAKKLVVGIAMGITMAATASAAEPKLRGAIKPESVFVRARAIPEFGAGAAGGAVAIVVGGLMVLGGYRKKRRAQ